ncbi:MAG TPA: hypothetical protein VH500_03830 [Nitrososphaeraceae archaeon]
MSRPLFRLLFILLPCLIALTLSILFGIHHIYAQNDKSDDSILIKMLIDQAIQSYQNNKIVDSISHLHAAYDELVIFAKMNDRNIVNARALESTLISTSNSLSEENESHYASATNNNSLIVADFNALEDQVGRDLLHPLPIRNTTLNNATNAAIPKGTFLVYQNERYGASVQYPSDWSIRIENDSNLQQHKPDYFRSKVIASFYLPRLSSGLPIFYIGTNSNLSKRIAHFPVTLKSYLDLAVKSKNLTNFPSLKIISSIDNMNNKNILSGSPAYELVWTYINPIYGPRKVMELGTLVGKDTGYFIDYSASIERFNDYLPLMQKMKDTFVS